MDGKHFNFELVIVQDPVKIVMLKMLANRKVITRALGKLPEGVFREIIKYNRF